MTLALEVLVPDGALMQVEAVAIRAVDATGSFGLRPGHEDFSAALVPSILAWRDGAGTERYVAVDGGVLVLEDDRVSIATRDAVASDDLETVSVAAESMLRARREQEREASRAFNQLVAELLEQLPNIRRSG